MECKSRKYCCVPQCKARKSLQVRMHKFPSNQELANKWKIALKIEKPIAKYMCVCSLHFKEEDYHLRTPLKQRHILKHNVEPTCNLPVRSQESKKKSQKKSTIKRKRQLQNQQCVQIQRKALTSTTTSSESVPKKSISRHNRRSSIKNSSKLGNRLENDAFESEGDVDVTQDIFNKDCAWDELSSLTSSNFKIETDEPPLSIDPLATEESDFSKVEIKIEEPELDDIKVEEPDLESFLPTDYEILQQNYKQLLQRTTDLENELCSSKSIITELTTKVKLLENELQNSTSTSEREITLNNKLKEFINNNNILSANQIDFAVYKKENKIVWSIEDLTKALTIRYLSMPCHGYLTETLKYPLPFTLSLQKWMFKIDMHHGVSPDVLDIMRIAALTMTNEEKTIVLHIDEMKVQSLYEYDEEEEEVIGPYSCMQIIMAQSLFSDWKQPVYIDFDKKLTTNILMDLIKRLYEVTYTVVACVSNYSGPYLQLCRELEISTAKTHFLHPITCNKIYYFAEAPQLLVSMHNWFSKTGFNLKDGAYVYLTAETLKYCVVDASFAENKLQHQKRKNINIARATDLFSETCAAVLKTSDTLLARNTGKFIEKISFWFKLMNASNTNPSKNNSNGCDLKFQSKELDSIYDMVKNMRCKGSIYPQLFQNGMLITTTSLKELFNDIKQKHPSKQIETHRLNFNSLNDLKSELKNFQDDHNNPSPLQAINKIRHIVLTKQYFLAEILKRADINMSHEIEKECLNEADVTSSLSAKTDNEEDTLLYLTDLIATKYTKDYPELSKQSNEENEHNHAIHLNFPQLNASKASVRFLRQTYLMDEVFVQFHPKGGLVSGKNVNERLFYFMEKRCGNMVPEEIMKMFIKHRTILRLKYANTKRGVDMADWKTKTQN